MSPRLTRSTTNTPRPPRVACLSGSAQCPVPVHCPIPSASPMQSFAQALDLRDDPALIQAYKEHHRHVWPEVVAALRGIGIRKMNLYLLGTRLFMYYEAPDDFVPERDYQTYATDPRCRAWDELMRKFQQRAPGAAQGAWWAPMECIFDLDAAAGSPQPTESNGAAA
jgi:L-rhamnose mutarotase